MEINLLLKSYIRGIILYGVIVFILATIFPAWIMFIIVLPILLIISIYDAMRLERYKGSINISNIVLITLTVFTISYLIRFTFIWLFNQPLEKVLIYYLSIITIIFYYNTSSRKVILRRFVTDFLAGFLILFIAIFSTYGPLYVLATIYGSLILIDWIRFLIVLPSMITVGFGEETLFRGLIQNVFKERFGYRKGVFLASFLFFALWHTARVFDYGLTINFLFYVLFTGILGVLLGLAYEGSQSLIPVIIAHALWDSYQISIQEIYVGIPYKSMMIAFLVSIIIYLLSLIYIRKVISSIYSR